MKKRLKSAVAILFCLSVLLTTFVSAVDLNEVKDMPQDPEYYSYEPLKWALDRQLVDVTDDRIEPKAELLRADVVDIMVRYLGNNVKGIDIAPYFTDVDANAWYYPSLTKGYQMGIIQGYANLLRPLDKVTREEAFTILARTLQLSELNEDMEAIKAFGDYTSISDWALKKIAALVRAGYVIGDDKKNINPKNYITKEEFITIIWRSRNSPFFVEPTFKPDATSVSNYSLSIVNDDPNAPTGIEIIQYGLSTNEGDIDLKIKSEVSDSVLLSNLKLRVSTVQGAGKRVSYFGMTLIDGQTYTFQELFNQLANIAEGWSKYVGFNIPVVNINKTNGTLGDLRKLYKLVNDVYVATINTRPDTWASLGITMHSETEATILYDIYDSFGNVTDRGVSITLNVAE